MSALRLGCSGWDYAEWVGPVYRSASESKLAAYARIFDTAEINSTFYRAPTPGMVHGWARYTHDEFRFAAKVPQTVTHDRLLDPDLGAVDDLRAFSDLMRPLLDAGKLGPLLLQLPPRLRFREAKLRPFLEGLPAEFTWALEPRNKSWMADEAIDTLRAHRVAYCIVDEPLLPPVVHVTAPTAYIRWHGHGTKPWYNYRYSEDELRGWVSKVQDVASRAKEVYAFFNNHYHGYAPENALQMLPMLGVDLSPAQQGAHRRIVEYRKGLVRSATGVVRRVTLDEFVGGEGVPSGGPVEHALTQFLDRGRMDRARRLPEAVVDFESGRTSVEAQVGEYHVTVDLSRKRIVHDCEDWASQLRTRRFCKHVGRLFLTLPLDRAKVLLEDLMGRREEWTFALPEA